MATVNRPTDPELAELVDRLADAVIIADPDGRILYWNDAATRIFGWSADEAVGGPLSLIIPERLRARHDAGYAETMRTGVTKYGEQLLEVPALQKSGEPLSIAFTVTLLVRDGDAHPWAIAAVIRDDTERWHERRDLRRRVAHLERDQTDADN